MTNARRFRELLADAYEDAHGSRYQVWGSAVPLDVPPESVAPEGGGPVVYFLQAGENGPL